MSGGEKVAVLSKVLENLSKVQDEALSVMACAEVVENREEIIEAIKQANTLVDSLDAHMDAAKAVLKKSKAFIEAA